MDTTKMQADMDKAPSTKEKDTWRVRTNVPLLCRRRRAFLALGLVLLAWSRLESSAVFVWSLSMYILRQMSADG
eukprot:1290738-Amphidinium_carterae.1